MSGSSFERPAAKSSGDRKAGGEKRKPLREVITEIDQDILKLLARRFNLLEKMRHKGRLDPAEEKMIREAWQAAVAKVSRDPQLSGRFFSLMQELSFLPRPGSGETENTPGDQRRMAFNLAPAKAPVDISLKAPVDSRGMRSWLYLSAAAGQKCRIQQTLQNDMEVDFEKALQRLDARVSYINDVAEVGTGAPIGWPDVSLFVGDSDFNFYLLLAHYLGHTSKVRFEGGHAMRLADFSVVRTALVSLGARMTHIIPKSMGLPCRVECSGILPDLFKASKDLPAQFCEALMLAAPFYEDPFAIDLSLQPAKKEICARIMPILEASGATFVADGDTLNFEPSSLSIPDQPDLPLDSSLAPYILALAVPHGGQVELLGKTPDWSGFKTLLSMLARHGIEIEQNTDTLKLVQKNELKEFDISEDDLKGLTLRQLPLLMALGASVKLAGGKASFPERIEKNADTMDFLRSCGIVAGHEGALEYYAPNEVMPVLNAPSPWWAMALAIAACSRRGEGFQLGNAGIITQIWPRFWYLYNNLPNPDFKKLSQEPVAPKEKSRRRILTKVVAVPREIREEDWER